MKKEALKKHNNKEVKKLREDLGMPPIRKGLRQCLRCSDQFESDDLKNQKICYQCRYVLNNLFSEPYPMENGLKVKKNGKKPK